MKFPTGRYTTNLNRFNYKRLTPSERAAVRRAINRNATIEKLAARGFFARPPLFAFSAYSSPSRSMSVSSPPRRTGRNVTFDSSVDLSFSPRGSARRLDPSMDVSMSPIRSSRSVNMSFSPTRDRARRVGDRSFNSINSSTVNPYRKRLKQLESKQD